MDLDETSTDPSARGKPAKRLSDKSKGSSKVSGGKSWFGRRCPHQREAEPKLKLGPTPGDPETEPESDDATEDGPGQQPS